MNATGKRWTLAEIRRANERGGGLFFCRQNMKFAGDTMRSFGVRHEDDGRVVVYRKPGHGVQASWEFNPEDGGLDYIMPE